MPRCPYRKCGQWFDTDRELDAHIIYVAGFDDPDHEPRGCGVLGDSTRVHDHSD